MELTTPDGYTEMKPVSWDYRFSNLCNFKCRMCGDMLSSAWESEQHTNNMIDLQNPKNNWMQPIIKEQITAFQDTVIEQEFAQAVEEHRVEEVYWAGGEPLMYEQHWRYMKRIIELGDGPRIYARYNTNLSRCDYRGVNLFSDILDHIRDYQICASLDGTGAIGEYIRTGLRYNQWLANFRRAVKGRSYSRQVRIDFTLTLPGLFEVERIVQLAQEYDTEILAKVVFSFTPDILLSPLALPRSILDRKINELVAVIPSGAMQDILLQLKQRPTFAEQWPDTYVEGLAKGKRRVLQLEKIRQDTYTLADILSVDLEIQEWYESIIA
jgi:sulfatase maturation enzyme AslB (radical SAM superfamily)